MRRVTKQRKLQMRGFVILVGILFFAASFAFAASIQGIDDDTIDDLLREKAEMIQEKQVVMYGQTDPGGGFPTGMIEDLLREKAELIQEKQAVMYGQTQDEDNSTDTLDDLIREKEEIH